MLKKSREKSFSQPVTDEPPEAILSVISIRSLALKRLRWVLLSVDDGDRFLTIGSDFEAGIYRSDFTLFEVSKSGYQKSKERIEQYYHTADQVAKALPNMRLITKEDVTLYGENADKEFLVFQKI